VSLVDAKTGGVRHWRQRSRPGFPAQWNLESADLCSDANTDTDTDANADTNSNSNADTLPRQSIHNHSWRGFNRAGCHRHGQPLRRLRYLSVDPVPIPVV